MRKAADTGVAKAVARVARRGLFALVRDALGLDGRKAWQVAAAADARRRVRI